MNHDDVAEAETILARLQENALRKVRDENAILRAENALLRKALEDAPHSEHCNIRGKVESV